MAFDYFSWAIENWYLPRKAEDSRKRAAMDPLARRPLPKLGGLSSEGQLSLAAIEAINAQCGKLTYAPDPLWGMDDYYNHPEYTQWRLENKRNDLPCDCDDYAVYAVALARVCGMAHDKGWIWNLIIDPAKQLSEAWANHVISAFAFGSGSERWVCIIDTNSAAAGKPVYFQGTADQPKLQETVIKHFSRIYNVSYYKLLRVPYPF